MAVPRRPSGPSGLTGLAVDLIRVAPMAVSLPVGPRRVALWRWAALFLAIWSFQLATAVNDAPPRVNDSQEMFDIGWCLAHGQGYAFGWDDPAFRRVWTDRHVVALPECDLLAHHGGPHATLARPPLVPVMLAAVVRSGTDHPFAAWRLVDATLLAAAVTVLIRAAGLRFGWPAGVAAAVLLVADPLRAKFVPGCLTEGPAFDGVAVTCALVLLGGRASTWRAVAAGGLTLGLVCLDRTLFLIAIPVWAVALGVAAGGPRRRQLGVAAGVLAVAVAIQLPWWGRNVAVAGRFMPLGTQGGENLPDEYSDWAVRSGGRWIDGGEMAAVWAAQSPAAARPGPDVTALFPEFPPFAALLHAETCESTATELAVAAAGQRAAGRWVRSHPWQLPRLFAAKLSALAESSRRRLLILAAAAAAGLWAAPARDRRPVWLLLAMAAAYAVAIGLTHVVFGRFLVPIMPALYVAAAAGVAALWRRAAAAVHRRNALA